MEIGDVVRWPTGGYIGVITEAAIIHSRMSYYVHWNDGNNCWMDEDDLELLT